MRNIHTVYFLEGSPGSFPQVFNAEYKHKSSRGLLVCLLQAFVDYLVYMLDEESPHKSFV